MMDCGERLNGIKSISVMTGNRPSDVKNSLADIHKAKRYIGYEPLVEFREGLRRTINWYQTNNG